MTQGEKKFDVLIIGGGPAAITIVKTLAGKKKAAVIRPEDHSMIYCAMPYVIEKTLPMEKTFKKDDLVTGTGAALIRDTVTGVDFEAKTVVTASGATYGYDKLVIATGASPFLPPVPGRDLEGVMTFKTEADLRKIHAGTENGLRRAVVVGAGAIGIELAQALRSVGMETHLVDMETQVLPNLVDGDMAKEAQERLAAIGINLHLGERVTALKGEKAVRELVLHSGKSIPLHSNGNGGSTHEGSAVVIFAVGVKADVNLFKGTGLEIGPDGIVVNERMETNVKDVYAAGDCVQFTNAITGDITNGKLATNAVPMGRVAAKNLLGEDATYKGFFNGAATKVEDLFIGGTGLSEKSAVGKFDIVTGTAELTTKFPIMPGASKVRLKLIADQNTGRILGGQVSGGAPLADKVDLITMAVQNGLTLDEAAMFSYSSQPYQSFFPADNLLVAAARDAKKQLQEV
jgi:NADH dehydrogenase/NADH oxidase (H2O2-forming)